MTALIPPAQTSKDAPIVITGASGFIATYIVRELLELGYHVRGTVRSAPESYETLWGLPGAAERLELVRAELGDEGAFDDVVRGAPVVMHTASPYVMNSDDPQRDLVEPAVNGTINVLNSCKKSSSVRRVVLTSSMAAITDEPDSSHVYTEADWNTRSSLSRNPYYYSKTLAERAAWRFIEEQQADFSLVVINPFLVIGPSLSSGINPSNQVILDLLKGTYPAVMSVAWGFVDVRDVAHAHVLAMEEEASGRYLCANQTWTMGELVAFLRAQGYEQGYKLPRLNMACGAGDLAVKLGSYFQPSGVGSYLRTHIGRTPHFDHARIRDGLGMAFSPLEQTLLDTLRDMEQQGHIPQRAQ